ncbi:hypothetical protein B0H21DRAFT_142301 [Amylocystis lapponica]|nr:hypothetical protein B0H21DRAFT_142301 [Amylocystis lapponica]
MKFTALLFSAALLTPALSRPLKGRSIRLRDVDPSLIPEFGVQPGVNPDGTGNCDGVNGANGQPIKIPCACPPDRNQFIADLNANLAAGHVVNNTAVGISFPLDGSTASQLARIEAATVTLQNLEGPGKGCPQAATTFGKQAAAIQAGTASSSPAASSPAASSPVASSPAASSNVAVASGTATSPAVSAPSASSTATGSSSGGVDPALVPQFGVTAGTNPDGTGNCDGVNGANGQPIKIPCACPPDRDLFIQDLNANLAAGHVVNNTVVGISFPIDNSTASQLARIQAATVTLQNLEGPGKGCPQAATTFGAQVAAIRAGGSSSVASSSADSSSVASSSAPANVAAASAPATSSVDPCAEPSDVASPTSIPAPSATASAPSTSSSGGVDPALVPEFGVVAGTNPDGTGNCDGVNGTNGQPILIPCACPPDRDLFIHDLNANLAAGHVVNNTVVGISFPIDNSTASQLARIQAATVTLQNLEGPGKGCPQAATTFGKQVAAIQAAASS